MARGDAVSSGEHLPDLVPPREAVPVETQHRAVRMFALAFDVARRDLGRAGRARLSAPRTEPRDLALHEWELAVHQLLADHHADVFFLHRRSSIPDPTRRLTQTPRRRRCISYVAAPSPTII